MAAETTRSSGSGMRNLLSATRTIAAVRWEWRCTQPRFCGPARPRSTTSGIPPSYPTATPKHSSNTCVRWMSTVIYLWRKKNASTRSLNGWERLSAIYQHNVRRSELPLAAVNTANHSHWLMDVHHNIDNRIQTDVILLDFQKAFAKVRHQRLLYKLPYYGISPQALNWVQSFLSNRRQHVQKEVNTSSFHKRRNDKQLKCRRKTDLRRKVLGVGTSTILSIKKDIREEKQKRREPASRWQRKLQNRCLKKHLLLPCMCLLMR